MATTSKGFPYPLGTDRVMDGDDAIKALAEAVDMHVGRLHAATTQVNVTTAGGAASVAVTFPAGRFTAIPVVVASSTAVGNPGGFNGAGNATSTTAGTIGASRVAGTGNVGISWIAIQV